MEKKRATIPSLSYVNPREEEKSLGKGKGAQGGGTSKKEGAQRNRTAEWRTRRWERAKSWKKNGLKEAL